MVEVFNNYKWIHLKKKGTNKSHKNFLDYIMWNLLCDETAGDLMWDLLPDRTICGESGGGGSSGWDDRGACLVWGWVCRSITSMPSSSRNTPPTDGQKQGTNIRRDMYGSEAPILGRQWPTLKLVMLEDAAGKCERSSCLVQCQAAQCWSVSTVPTSGHTPPQRVHFWQFERIRARQEPAGGPFLWFLPFLPAQRSQYGPAAVLLTSLSTWYNLSTFNIIFGYGWKVNISRQRSLIWTERTWFKDCRIWMFVATEEHWIKHLNTLIARMSDAFYQGSGTKWICKSQDSLFWTLTVGSLDSFLHIYGVCTDLTWRLTFLCVCNKVKVFMFAPLTGRFGQLSPRTNTEPCRGGERPPRFMGMSVN